MIEVYATEEILLVVQPDGQVAPIGAVHWIETGEMMEEIERCTFKDKYTKLWDWYGTDFLADPYHTEPRGYIIDGVYYETVIA